MSLKTDLAKIPQLKRGQVWCKTCGHTQRVNGPGAVMGGGWPKCCGYTMTIDSPAEQDRFDARAFGIQAFMQGEPQRAPSPGQGDRAYKLAWMKEWLRGYRHAKKVGLGK